MCGVVGWAFDPASARADGLLREMTDTLRHRGPDGHGAWRSSDGAVAFGHRRLSIIDPSSAGDQPMQSASGRFTITYNGEIYNHLDLRARLEDRNEVPEGGWRGHSDTETLLVAIEAWGVERALQQASGMFAFGLWDDHEGALTLARDRFGEKPLYVAAIGEGLAFASELKAIVAHPAFVARVDPDALRQFVHHGYVKAPRSIYSGAGKLLPGTYATVRREDVASLSTNADFLAPFRRHYWRLRDQVEQGVEHPFAGSADEAVDALETVLGNAVRSQQISDVPLGAFLSGGIDSSTIVALMQARSGQPVRTFTIAFEDEAYDESPYAAAVAEHLGTVHTSVILSPNDALDRIRRIPRIWDEPFADVSQLPTLLVAEVARREVTVALSGDGGDELFGGYERYDWTERMWRVLRIVPRGLRHVTANLLKRVPPAQWDQVLRLFRAGPGSRLTGDRILKLAHLVPAGSPDELYDMVLSPWKRPEPLLLSDAGDADHWSGRPRLDTLVETMMFRDAVDYLPDDLMVKVDRAAMSTSLESRAPFLDREVASFAWSLPLHMKRRNGEGKWLVRKLLQRHVPADLVDRPKAGFTLPMDDWLKGPLRAWAESLLDPASLRDGGLDPEPIRRAWTSHLAGTEDHRYVLWNILTYQDWRDTWL